MTAHIVYLDDDTDTAIKRLSHKTCMPISLIIRTLVKLALRAPQGLSYFT